MAGSFVQPPPPGVLWDYSNLTTLHIGSIATLEWTGSGSDSSLYLMKDLGGFECFFGRKGPGRAAVACSPILSVFTEDSYDWLVQTYNITYDLARPIYYFLIMSKDGTQSFASHYINILPSGVGLSTTSTSTYRSSTTSTLSPPSSSHAVSLPSTTVAPSGTLHSSDTPAGPLTSSSTSESSSESLESESELSSLSLTSSTSAMSPAISPAIASTAPAAMSTNSGASHSTSLGMPVGLSLGIGISLIAALAALGFLLFRRRNTRYYRRHGAAKLASEAGVADMFPLKGELDGRPRFGDTPLEMDGTPKG